MALGTQIFILILLLAFSGLFSGVETAMISTNMIKAKSLVKQKRKGSETLLKLKKDPNRLIITLLIGNNLMNIGAASLATVISTNLFGSSGVGIATGVMTFLVLIFGEITPKTFAAQNATKISLIAAKPVEILSYILYPLIKLFKSISYIMLKLLGSKGEKQVSEEELMTIVTMGRQEGILKRLPIR